MVRYIPDLLRSHKETHQLGGVDELDIASLSKPWDDTGLVLYLPFSENEGAIARDVSHYGNHGTFKAVGEPAWAEGRIGPGVKFDGVNDYIKTGLNINELSISGFTFEFWFYADSAGAGTKCKLYSSYINGSNYCSAEINADNQVRAYGIFGGKAIRTNLFTITHDQWYHFVAVYDGTNYKLFIDGDDKGCATPNSIGTLFNTTIDIGWNIANQAEVLNGKIDEFRAYNRALSADEIKMHYLRSFGMAAPPIFGATQVREDTRTVPSAGHGTVGLGWDFIPKIIIFTAERTDGFGYDDSGRSFSTGFACGIGTNQFAHKNGRYGSSSSSQHYPDDGISRGNVIYLHDAQAHISSWTGKGVLYYEGVVGAKIHFYYMAFR